MRKIKMNFSMKMSNNRIIYLKNRLTLIGKKGFVKVYRQGFRWNVDLNSCIGKSIAYNGFWEPDTTRLILDFVKPGMHVMDIGANIGYYTLLMARAVQPNGIVWAFEPVEKFRNQLQWHINANNLQNNVKIFPFGLSDKNESLDIIIDNSSATLHPTEFKASINSELITLKYLDNIIDELRIDHIDFIKIDIDGHEPRFLKGAAKTLHRFHPPIALEFAQHCLHAAGSDVREQANLLKDLGYSICRETTFEPYASEIDFLKECGNFDHSGNALAIVIAKMEGI